MSIKSVASKLVLKAQEKSPELLLAGGLILGGVTLVMACKQTLKADSVMKERKSNMEDIDDLVKDGAHDLTEDDGKKLKRTININTAVQLGKIYAPAAATGALSLFMILASYKIMKTRNVALAAAYKILEESFKKYRSNVVERYGEEEDESLFSGNKLAKDVAKKRGVQEEDTKTYQSANPYKLTLQRSTCHSLGADATTNEFQMNSKEMFFSKRLRDSFHRHVLLNDIFDTFGVPRTKEGAIVGWKYGNGDDFVDFGLYDRATNRPLPHWADFLEGRTDEITLSFNCDGVIYDLL